MGHNRTYESFPLWIPSVSCTQCLIVYFLGAYIMLQLGVLFAGLYAFFCVWVEYRIMRGSCVHCYYYGKLCGLGRGKLAAALFKKGDPAKFTDRDVSWKDMVPDFLVLIFPLAGGAAHLIKDFTWTMLVLLVILAFVSLAGNAFIRGSLACKYCKQRELGCPALDLFSKGKSPVIAGQDKPVNQKKG